MELNEDWGGITTEENIYYRSAMITFVWTSVCVTCGYRDSVLVFGDDNPNNIRSYLSELFKAHYTTGVHERRKLFS